MANGFLDGKTGGRNYGNYWYGILLNSLSNNMVEAELMTLFIDLQKRGKRRYESNDMGMERSGNE